jgi:hypothetical protein
MGCNWRFSGCFRGGEEPRYAIVSILECYEQNGCVNNTADVDEERRSNAGDDYGIGADVF